MAQQRLTVLVRCNKAGAEYLTEGETYFASQSRPGADWRLVEPQSWAGTFIRARNFERMMVRGDLSPVN